MKESLCAHCKNCEEVKYDGFVCDCTGYIEDKTTSTGCVMFEDDGFVNSKTTNKEENAMKDLEKKYDKADSHKSRCRDCACLVEGSNGSWVCDELGKDIHNIQDEDCPEEF